MMTPRSSIFFSILFCILLVFLNIHTSQTISTDKPKSITLKLHHVSSLYPDLSPEALFKLNRVKHQRLGSNSDNGSKIDEGFETPITPGTNTSPFLSEYFAVLRIGLSPSNRYILLMDTSSPLTWIQCLPCSQCFKQVAPMYDPLLSPTYSAKNCSEYKSVCTGCNESGECTYVQINDDDRSVLMGVIAGEVFRFDQSVFLMNLTFGCMDYSSLTYKGMDGVLGLGRGELSFPSQLNSKFSYCLGDKSKSSLRFGQDVLDHPNQIVYTPMIHPKFDQSNYFINLTNITVADYNFPTTHMVLPDGIMIDPGSRDTYLPMIVFQAVRESFNIAALQLGWKLVESESPNNLCYNMSEFTRGISTIKAPGVTLYFAGDAFLELKFQNLFYNFPRVDVNLYCLAVRASESYGIPILGSTLQQGIRVVYDNGASVIGFDPNSC